MKPCLGLTFFGLLGVLVACQGSPPQEPPSSESAALPSVTATAVDRGQVAACLQTTGTLDPYRESKVGPRIAGTVARVLVEEGDRVKEGDPLVQLDADGFRLAVEEARAALGVAEAQLKQILTGSRPELIGQAQARLNEARAHLENAAAERRRVESLFQKSTLPQKSLDQAVAHHEASEAAFRSAQEGLRMAKTGATQEEILVARAQMDLARATLHRAEQALADAQVRAPFSGVVIRRFTNEGEYVTTMGQSPLVLLMAMDPLDLRVQIPEVHLLDVAMGNDVEIRPDALPGQVFHGRVTEIIPAVDPVSRTFRALVRIPNPEGRLSPGMFCRVRLSTCMRDSALRVPGEAIFRQAGQTLVYLLQEDRIRKRTVTVGTTDERFVEILSGLQEGDRVVVTVEGGASLEEGTRVAIHPVSGGPAPASESSRSPGTRP